MKAMETPRLLGLVIGGLIIASSLVYVACDSGSDNAIKETVPTPDSGLLPDGAPIPVPEGGAPDSAMLPDGAPLDCFPTATTHFQIINACTDAVKITKNPTLALQLSDGGLPPLP